MGTIQSSIQITDGMSPAFRAMNNAMMIVLNTFDNIQAASHNAIDTSSIESARNQLNIAGAEFTRIEEQIEAAKNQQDSFTSSIKKSECAANSLTKTLMGFSVVQKVISLVSNQVGSAFDRMDTMTNFTRTMTAISGSSEVTQASLKKTNAAVKGTAYGLDVAAAAVQNLTTRGMNIASATNEVSKWMDAVSFYGKGTNEQLSGVTDALGKMLSKGTVEMEQLNRLTDAGINAVGIYAQVTGQSSAAVQDALSDGEISAMNFITTVSNAFEEGTNGVLNISGAAKEAGGTWATSIANMKAAVTRGIISVIDSINGALTNAGFGTILTGIESFGDSMENILNQIGNTIGTVITMSSPLLHLIQTIGDFVTDDWSIIAPIVIGIVAAIAAYNAVLFINNAIQGISSFLEGIATIAAVAHGDAITSEMLATVGMTEAQLAFNAALYACPITWIIIAIIAIIAIIYAVIAVINKVAETSISATGVIAGAFATVGAVIGNILLGIVDIALGVVETIINRFIDLANFLGNVFNDPVTSIIKLFENMLDSVLNIIQHIASALDKVFGGNLEYQVEAARTNWTNKADEMAEKYGGKFNLFGGTAGEYKELPRVELDVNTKRFNYSDAYNAGYNWGASFEEKIKGMFSMPDIGDEDLEKYNDILKNVQNAASDTDAIKDNTNETNKKLSSIDDNLSLIKNFAEREAINQFTTQSVKVEMNNVNTISSDMDIDGMTNKLLENVVKAANGMAEGVHA